MKKIFIGLLIAVLAVWGFAHFGQNAQAEENRIDFATLIARIAGTVEEFINEEVAKRVEVAVEAVKVKLGSVVGPELFSDFWTVNNVTEYSFEQSMITATGTVCAFTPPSATTTLVVSADNINAVYTSNTPTSTGVFSIFLTDRNGATTTTGVLFSASTTVQTFNGAIVPTTTVATTVPGYTDATDRRILFHFHGGTSNTSNGSGVCRLKLFELN